MNPIIIEIAPDEVLLNNLDLCEHDRQLFGDDIAFVYHDELAIRLGLIHRVEARSAAPSRCTLTDWNGCHMSRQIRFGWIALDPYGETRQTLNLRLAIGDAIREARAATLAELASLNEEAV